MTPEHSHVDSADPEGAAEVVSRPLPGEQTVVWTIWMTYGAFYFCRNNLAVALPGIEAELGHSKTDMAVVLLGLKIAYGAGQFVNGQLAEQLSPRRMLAVGMLASAALNWAFGFGSGLYFFIFVWAVNGYAQSLGWTPCVRVVGNWVPIVRRGRAIGVIGTGYQLTAGLTYLVAGVSVSWFGWRGALWVPPAILAAAALVMLMLLEERPFRREAARSGTPGFSENAGALQSGAGQPGGGGSNPSARPSFLENMRLTLSNPALWVLALSLGMLNACRYGFVDWGVSHLVSIETIAAQRQAAARALASAGLAADDRRRLEDILAGDVQSPETREKIEQAENDGLLPEIKKAASRSAVLRSAVQYAVLPLGAILGSFLAGWATDRFFGGRRAPVICGLLVVLGALALSYDAVARSTFVGTMVVLLLVGFCIFGPQVLLVGTAPADLARQGTSAAAAGFVNCVGYFGAAFAGDLLTGYLADEYGWETAIYGWAGWAFAAAVLSAFLWNARGHSPEVSCRPSSSARAAVRG